MAEHDNSFSEADLARRIAAREALAGQRSRLRCVRCLDAIPEDRRADAKYCSDRCRRRYRFERLTQLRREVYLTVRELKTVTRCPCGTALDTRVRPGPVPRLCRRCYMREQMRRWRAARREAAAGGGTPCESE